MSNKENNIEEEKNLNTKPSSGYFTIDRAGLVTLFDKSGRNEAFNEDIIEIENLGGTDGILSRVRTSFERGLSNHDKNDLSQRVLAFGENKFYVEPMPHCCFYVWEGLEDLMIRILVLAAIFQIIVGSIPLFQETPNDWVEGISIVVAVVIVVSVGSITNFTKEKKFRELNDKNNSLVKFTVRRDGEAQIMQDDQIYVGDIIKIDQGMILPADGYILEGNEIKIEEASLTGESDLIEKESLEQVKSRIEEELERLKGKIPTEKHLVGSPLIFSGTQVAEGTGWYVALRIGPSSEKGKIQEQVAAEQQKKKKGGKKAEAKSGESPEVGEGDKKEGDKKEEDKKEEDKKEEGKKDEDKKEEDKKEEEKEEEDDEDEGKTPLELKLDVLANDVGMFGIAAAALTLASLTIRLIYTTVTSQQLAKVEINYQISNWYNTTLFGEESRKREEISGLRVLTDVLRMIILCVAIIVVAIPEGLPLAVTLSLAFSIGKMMEDNNLVRKMNACETMGGANYICSDKTGTLTKNEMSVETYFDGLDVKSFKALTAEKDKREDPINYFNARNFEIFRYALTFNIDVDIDMEEKIVKGSQTDYAFVHLLHNLNEKIFDTKNKELKGEEVKKRFPFSSSRKKMSSIISTDKFTLGNVIFQKGASEIVLNSCRFFLDPNTNEPSVITDEKLHLFKDIIKTFADQALRTICMAYKDITEEQSHGYKVKDENGNNIIENDGFTLIGIFGIKDQLRPNVAEAVDKCKKAGITVVMVTGDNIDTANAIARECHIITEEDEKKSKEEGKPLSYTGKDFYEKIGGMKCDSCNADLKFCNCPRSEGQAEVLLAKKKEINPNFNDEITLRKERIVKMDKFKEIYPDIRVIARSRPEDKYTMVYGLRQLDQVVAVTGDGTNDAPALSKSDVGFAMGISGTDIAKQAADIIILDDNFATIVQSVKWGRNIYDNIRKFIQFQLTVNICACLLVFIAACIGKETPLSAIQMLWVNLIMDSLGSLALATEPPHENLLNRKPYPKTEYIINNLMWKHTFWQAMVELALMIFFYLYAHRFFPESNPDNIAVAEKLNACYGYIPGQEGLIFQDKYKMIAGPTIFWPRTTERNPDTLPATCDDFYKYKNLDEAHHYFIAKYGSTHLTVIFNTFVIYTLFNQINARVIDDSYNIFVDIHKNYLFLVIILVELALQAIIVSIGEIAFKVAVGGLDGPQWGICFAFGTTTFLVAIILKPIPLEKCFEAFFNCVKKMKEEKEKKEEEEKEKNEVEEAGNVEMQGQNNNQIIGVVINVQSKNASKNNIQRIERRESENKVVEAHLSHHSHYHHEGERKPNATLLNLRRPSMTRQLTNRQQSLMRNLKE